VGQTGGTPPAASGVPTAEPPLAQKQLSLRGNWFRERERIAELGGFLLQVLQLALAEAFVLLCSPNVVVWYPVCAHMIHGAGDRMRRGDTRLCGAKPPLQATVKCPTGTVGTQDS
jgi:hypothetical protein